ncbi:M14 family zinc carboxypeptidase [Actinopolymorpha alba]|uniref:M14 family zinc carboxypeptidase n=1 Tax=Actinopolymorpha alba TaxID=533267 RepID=UPI000378FDA1|nr:M14 family zinc carboxypeptidase [Actinopolymorpha alba]
MDLDPVHLSADVPENHRFPTVDELTARFERLAQEYSDLATLHRIGTSRLGEPLRCLTIGTGATDAVVFAGVHPNEPVGSVTAEHLASVLCRDDALRNRLGLRWHIVPCIDPDGARLNERWFGGPFTRSSYGRHFYRPAPNEQVEWTFPFAYKKAYSDRVLPETLALMRLIDDTRPVFMCSLHNGEHGGVYYYLSRPAAPLYPRLHAVPAALGLPLYANKPETPYTVELAAGIYEALRNEDAYDFLEGLGLDPLQRAYGGPSWSYAERWGTLTLVSEVPYWAHPDAASQEPIEEGYADLLRARVDKLADTAQVLTGVLDAAGSDLTIDSPYLRAVRAFVPSIAKTAEQELKRAGQVEGKRPATRGERFNCLDSVHMFRLRNGGMLLQALDSELAAGNVSPAIRGQHRMLSEVYACWAEAAEQDTAEEPIPIRSLVRVQYGAILVTAAYAVGANGGVRPGGAR